MRRSLSVHAYRWKAGLTLTHRWRTTIGKQLRPKAKAVVLKQGTAEYAEAMLHNPNMLEREANRRKVTPALFRMFLRAKIGGNDAQDAH